MNGIRKMYKIERSLIGVVIAGNEFSLTTLKGRPLYEEELIELIQRFLPEIILEGITLTQSRVNKFKVCAHIGMSGCEDRWIEYIKDVDFFPVIGRSGVMHISKSGKFTEDITNLWLGDLVELLDLTEQREETIEIKEVELKTESELTIPEWLKE